MNFSASLIALSTVFLGFSEPQATEKVSNRVVKYAGLAETINKHKGKVIVVDFWAEW